jgi:ethanolamine utilization protein EutA (predicted chaperonin)
MSHASAAPEQWLGRSAGESVELTTVGIDVGSSTTHAVFARVRLRRQAQALSSRYAVVQRDTFARAPISLTPYRGDGRIDADLVEAMMARAYAQAGVRPDGVDSGAVILTGVALERPNAQALSQRLAGGGGRFVCASAGHRLEATLAAHGSGAVAYSREVDGAVLHIDIGGGTSKLSLIVRGEIVSSAAVRVGGRLVVLDGAEDDAAVVTRVEPAAETVAAAAGVRLAVGAPLSAAERRAVAERMAAVLVEVALGGPLSPLAAGLMVTPPLAAPPGGPAVTTLSGGVAEYVFDRCGQRFGDLGPELAAAVRTALTARLRMRTEPVGELIRATVIGAAEFTVQLSGSTVHVSDESALPLRNVPVARPVLASATETGGRAGTGTDPVAEAVARALERVDVHDPAQPVAVALPRLAEPCYAALRGLAEALAAAVPGARTGRAPLVLAVDGDLGLSLGRVLVEEVGVRAAVVALDELELQELDYVDVGAVVYPAGAVPVVVKSLLFGAARTGDPG